MNKLKLVYHPLQAVIQWRWQDNPKNHNLDKIKESIMDKGFKDPPAYDQGISALVEGNGRVEALMQLKEEGSKLPKGIVLQEGDWWLPVLEGIDLDKAAAIAYAIDHNNISFMGASGANAVDLARMWQVDKYLSFVNDATVSVTESDIEMLKKAMRDLPNWLPESEPMPTQFKSIDIDWEEADVGESEVVQPVTSANKETSTTRKVATNETSTVLSLTIMPVENNQSIDHVSNIQTLLANHYKVITIA